MGTRHTIFFMDEEYPNVAMGGGSGGGGGSSATLEYYKVVGYIFSTTSGNNNAWGQCEIMVFGNHARLEFSVQITGSGASDDFNWGLDIDKIRAIDSSIPNIKATSGGTWDTYSGYISDKMQWSPTLQATTDGKKWRPARYYQQDPSYVGSWSAATWGNGSHLRGVAYGEIE